MKIEALRSAILTWAHNNGILSENVPIEAEGNIKLVPFKSEMAEYFRTRKIVRIEVDGHRISVFSRLPIAATKKKMLKKCFDDVYAQHRYQIRIDSSKPFKVDQAVQAYGKFEPLRKHKGAICCGSSIGLGNQRNAGTLTALARGEDERIFGLSCNHVVGGCSIAQPGTPVVSPGIQDVSVENNHIIVIGDYVRPAQMAQGLPSVIQYHNNRDLACFEIRKGVKVTSLQGSGTGAYDTPTTFAKPIVGLPVKKWGRSTGLTKGEITYVGKSKRPEPIDYNVTCYYGPMNSQTFKGTVYFDEVYEVTPTGPPFSLGGDSGALVVTDHPEKAEKVVGIVIAGERNKSIVLPLKVALRELKLKLISGY